MEDTEPTWLLARSTGAVGVQRSPVAGGSGSPVMASPVTCIRPTVILAADTVAGTRSPAPSATSLIAVALWPSSSVSVPEEVAGHGVW